MAKALTMPTAPEAPIAPQISIGDRIHGIENRIEEIEGISGINGVSKSGSKSQKSEDVQEDEQEQTQVQSQQKSQPRQTQSTPQVQQRQPSARKVETPETMARDAVANGSGALTKRTTRRGEDDRESEGADSGNSQSKNQTTVVVPPNSALNDDGQTSFERGRAILNEFKQLDREEAAKQSSLGADTTSSSSTPGLFVPSSYDSNSHGVAYWLFTLVAVGVLAFVFVRQFLVNKDSSSGTPPLTKSTLDIPDISKPLMKDSLAMKQAALNQYKQNLTTQAKSKVSPTTSTTPVTKPFPPVNKPVTLKTKPQKAEEDKKGTHFEVRV